jgi:hypothetical protein
VELHLMSEDHNVSRHHGNSIGHCWRTELATQEHAANLRGLWSKMTDKASNAWDSWFARPRSEHTPGERLFFIISPKEDGDRAAAQEFWSELGAAADPSDKDFVQGFAEGALGLDAEGKVDEKSLRKVVAAAIELERPTLENIVDATGICEDCAGRLLHAAETFGFVTYEQPH